MSTPKPIEIFRPGRHTSAAGIAIEFTQADLEKTVANYDPGKHEAPIVVGHPKDNAPAYGWVKALQFNAAGGLEAIPDQVDHAFSELVKAGRYKKVSASFYTPTAQANPVPGTYYLRHVGFLGAQPPALKGLKDVAFSDPAADIVEFAGEYDDIVNAGLWRSLREWIIGKFGQDEADKVIPQYDVSTLESEARKPEEQDQAQPIPSFSETHAMSKTAEQLQAEIDALKADNAAKDAKIEGLNNQVAAFNEAAAKAEKAKLAADIDQLVQAGKVTPAERDKVQAFAEGLSNEAGSMEFSENGQTTQTSQREFYIRSLHDRKPAINFGEGPDFKTPDQGDNDTDKNRDIARRAQAYREKMSATGYPMSFAEAVDAVNAGKDR